jgi:tetratricopeptide (TPR) repeat protein
MKHARQIIAALMLSLGSIGATHASYDRNLTPGELALLPAFCQDVQTVNGWEQGVRESPRAPMWVSKLGRSFWDMHHYCWARIAVHRSLAIGLNQNQRDHLVETAIDDMLYVVRRAPATMVLLPEIYYLMGDYFRMLRRYGEAQEAFQKSRELKPDYWPAYAGMADLLVLSGRRADARAVLEQGLTLMPGEVALKTRLARLSGTAAPSAAGGARTAAAARPAAAPSAPAAVKN